jgi:hypothetical protein
MTWLTTSPPAWVAYENSNPSHWRRSPYAQSLDDGEQPYTVHAGWRGETWRRGAREDQSVETSIDGGRPQCLLRLALNPHGDFCSKLRESSGDGNRDGCLWSRLLSIYSFIYVPHLNVEPQTIDVVSVSSAPFCFLSCCIQIPEPTCLV